MHRKIKPQKNFMYWRLLKMAGIILNLQKLQNHGLTNLQQTVVLRLTILKIQMILMKLFFQNTSCSCNLITRLMAGPEKLRKHLKIISKTVKEDGSVCIMQHCSESLMDILCGTGFMISWEAFVSKNTFQLL